MGFCRRVESSFPVSETRRARPPSTAPHQSSPRMSPMSQDRGRYSPEASWKCEIPLGILGSVRYLSNQVLEDTMPRARQTARAAGMGHLPPQRGLDAKVGSNLLPTAAILFPKSRLRQVGFCSAGKKNN